MGMGRGLSSLAVVQSQAPGMRVPGQGPHYRGGP